MADKVFCDPVYHHIVFDKAADAILLKLIACPEVQRLRRIRQLGVSSYTYHGAEHSRFGHALGTCHMMTKALESLDRNQPELDLPSDVRLAARCAALLHDTGHGPFSHLIERICNRDHEKATTEIITGDTQVGKVLRGVSEPFPNLVADLLDGFHPEHQFLSDLLSSQLDVDRMDFILRDTHYCGVSFGVYDHLRILHTMRIREFAFDKRLHPVWLLKGSHCVEEFLYARFFMYWTVYYHKTTRGFESLFQAILERAKEVASADLFLPGIQRLLAGDIPLGDFLRLDDSTMLAQISLWQDSRDHILANLAHRFLDRDGFKPIGPASLTPDNVNNLGRAQDTMRSMWLDPEYYLLVNRRQTIAYDYYRPEEETGERTPKTSIMLEDEHGHRHEIAHKLPGIEALGREQSDNTYYYVPREAGEEVFNLLNTLAE